MERYSWQVHFRNWYTYRRDWRSVPVSGTIRVDRSRRFFVECKSDDSHIETRQSASLREIRCTGQNKFGVGDGSDFAVCFAWPCMGSPSRIRRLRPRNRRRLPRHQPRKQSITAAGTRPAIAPHLRPLLRRAKAPAVRRAPNTVRRSAASRRLTRVAPGKFRQRSSASTTCRGSLRDRGTAPRRQR